MDDNGFFFQKQSIIMQYNRFRGLNFTSVIDYNGLIFVSRIHYNRLESMGTGCATELAFTNGLRTTHLRQEL